MNSTLYRVCLRLTLSISILIICFQTKAQFVKTPYLHDLDAHPIFGMVNVREYAPENQLVLVHRSDSYERGKVYYKNGNKEKGLVQYANKQISYRATKGSKKIKVKAEEVLGLTIGIDSFFVAEGFNMERKSTGSKKVSKPQFMQYLTSFNELVFAKHYHFNSNGSIVETYQVSKDKGTSWKSFPKTSSSFKKVARHYFGEISHLNHQIVKGTLDHNDMMTLIKSSEYYYQYKRNEPISYDEYWNEVSITNNSAPVYKAEILSLEDSIWTVRYTKTGDLLYDVQYSSVYPFRKNGYLKNYNGRADWTEKIVYKNDKIQSQRANYNRGERSYLLKNIGGSTQEKGVFVYEEVKNPAGVLLNESGIWTDSIRLTNGYQIHKFDKNKLKSAYHTQGNKKYYQLTDASYVFKLKKLQKSLDNYFLDKDAFIPEVNDGVEGTYFIHLKLSDKGKPTTFNILNSIHSGLDKKILKWGKKVFLSSESMTFKPYKIDKEKVASEFLLSLRFSIVKFYRKPTSYYNSWFLQQQMMMQMMNQPLPPPTNIPSF